MPLAEDLMSNASGAVVDAVTDAGELVLDAAFGSAGGAALGGRRLRRALLVLLVVGAIAGIAIWRRAEARMAPAPPAAGPA